MKCSKHNCEMCKLDACELYEDKIKSVKKEKGDGTMKVKVSIEEIITQTFEIEVEATDLDSNDVYEEIRRKYKDGKIVLENPSLIEASCMIYDKNGEETDWNNMHV